MDFDYQKEDKLLQIRIKDEIDHHTTETIRRRVDYEIQRYLPRKVIFNFDNVSFMDSAGIGLLVGRYKLISMLGGSIILKNVKFDNIDFTKAQIFNTRLKDIDLSTCIIQGLSTTLVDIKGAIINELQIMDLAYLLNIKIKD